MEIEDLIDYIDNLRKKRRREYTLYKCKTKLVW